MQAMPSRLKGGVYLLASLVQALHNLTYVGYVSMAWCSGYHALVCASCAAVQTERSRAHYHGVCNRSRTHDGTTESYDVEALVLSGGVIKKRLRRHNGDIAGGAIATSRYAGFAVVCDELYDLVVGLLNLTPCTY